MSGERKMRKSAGEEIFSQELLNEVIEQIEKGLEAGILEVPVDPANDWDKGAGKGIPSKGFFRIVYPDELSDQTFRGSQERIEELANYYDHTDTTELGGEDVTAQVQIEQLEDMEQVSIRLPREDLEQIRRRASAAGIGYTTMIRMIVHAHLENPLTY